MRPPDASFMRRCMRRYYFERFDMIELPSDMPKREFGYRRADSGMVRHLQLHNPTDLRVLLLQAVPLEVYVSNARYLLPSQPISEKVWEDAHLIFDIDAKDLDLECRLSHTVTACEQCGHSATDVASPCGRCGHRGVRKTSVACNSCMKAAGEQAGRLLEILADLGVCEGVRVYFSGNEGFHVHVHDEQLARLRAAECVRLANYVAFRGMLPRRLGVDKKGATSLPRTFEGGWRGRFARKIVASKAARSLMAREMASGRYDTFARILKDMEEILEVRIDPGVTMDVHRIFRMPGTINGKSGMAKVPCEDPKKFDPYVSAVVLSDEPVHVRASCPVPIRMMKRRFGPYSNEYVEVPAYAAAYMVCKGLAHVVE